MKKNLFAAMLLAISCALFSNAQEENSTEFAYLFPEPHSWDFGIQLNQGAEYLYRPNVGAPQAGSSEVYGITRLALFLQYQINKKSNLKLEASAGLYERLGPTLSIQYGYQFASRWTAYGGIGIEYNTRANDFFLPSQNPQMREFIPRAQVGVRYQASKSIFLDLRYEGDIIKRSKIQNLPTSIGRINTVTLGAGLRF